MIPVDCARQRRPTDMKPEHFHVLAATVFATRVGPMTSTMFDRWVLGRIQQGVAGARIRFMLWDGFELPSTAGPPVGTIVFKNRRALLQLGLGSRSEFRRSLHVRRRRDPRRSGRAARGDLSRARRTRAGGLVAVGSDPQRLRAAKDNVHHHYDLGNEFYRLWLDREHGLHVRVLPDAGRHARRGADREDGSRLPQAAAEARRARGRGGLRLGLAGAVHGPSTTASRSRAFNISAEQIAYARDAGEQEGLADRVEFVEDDYRNVRGRSTRSCRSACSSTSAWPTIATLGGVIDRSLTATRPRPAALHRPQPAGAAEPVDPEADLSGRVSADAGAKSSSACSSRGTCRCSTSRTCGCTTRTTLEHWRQRFDAAADERGRACSTRRSSAPGGSISPDRRRRSRPARCSCSRWCSRAARATRSRGRDATERRRSELATMDNCDVLIVGGGPGGLDVRLEAPPGRARRHGLDAAVVSARQGLRRLDHAAGRRPTGARRRRVSAQATDVPADHGLPGRA